MTASLLHFHPRTFEIRSVIRGRPLKGKLFRLTLRNRHETAVRPVFRTGFCFVTVGPRGVAVEDLPVELDDGRDEWRGKETIEAGAKRDFFVYLDPLHADFPESGDGFITLPIEIFAEVDGRRLPAGTLPIVVGQVLSTLPPFSGIVAIDFGTTSTCAVASTLDRWQPDLVQLEESVEGTAAEVGSLVAYQDVRDRGNPDYAIGSEARLLLGQLGGAEVISSVKRYVGSNTRFLVGADGSGQPVRYTPIEVGSHVVAEVKRRIQTHINDRAVVELVCTYPTAFRRVQVQELGEIFKSVQEEVRGQYDFEVDPYRMLLDEATAASIFYLSHRFGSLDELREQAGAPTFCVLCYDLGGGTTDLSLTSFRLEQERGTRGNGRTVIRCGVLGQDGLPFYGGDNMTLSVFRLLKTRYARLLAPLVRAGRVETGEGEERLALERAANLLLERDADLDAWLLQGDPVPVDASVGYGGHDGVHFDDELRDAVDHLVPTRHHDRYDFPGDEQERRQQCFYDLWLAAENAKKAFGTPDESGTYPVRHQPPPPEPLLSRYGIGPDQLAVSMEEPELRAHLGPWLEASLARATTLLQEANVSHVEFFVMAGNACRLPLVQEVFRRHLEPFGASDPRRVFFDPVVAKTAVAQGACLLAIHEAAASGVRWVIERPEERVDAYVGPMTPPGIWVQPELTPWFKPSDGVPCVRSVDVGEGIPQLPVYEMRRRGGQPERIGIFMFRESAGRYQGGRIPSDLARALDVEPGWRDLPTASDETRGVAVLTEQRRLYLFRDDTWYAIWPLPFSIPDEQNAFSGTQ